MPCKGFDPLTPKGALTHFLRKRLVLPELLLNKSVVSTLCDLVTCDKVIYNNVTFDKVIYNLVTCD